MGNAQTLRTSGAESLSAGGNIFLGQTESPLLIRPYVSKMTESELMAVMVGGFATVAGGVMGAFVLMLRGYFSRHRRSPDRRLGHERSGRARRHGEDHGS